MKIMSLYRLTLTLLFMAAGVAHAVVTPLGGYETTDPSVTVSTTNPNPPDPTCSVAVVSTGSGGLSILNEGDKLCKLTWTNETDGSASVIHTWNTQTFDLLGNDRILIDFYIPSSSGVGGVGIFAVWDGDAKWLPMTDTLVEDMWYTAEFPVTTETYTNQNSMTISLYGITETSGVVYMDNIRLANFTPVIKEIRGEEKRIDIVCEHIYGGPCYTLDTWPEVTNGYNIYRAQGASNNFVKINSEINQFNVYSDYTNDYGVTYKYKVTSVVNGVESAFSAEASATTAASTYSDDELLISIQRAAFRFMWEDGHLVSGMTRKTDYFRDHCYPGYGVDSILVGANRGYITREEAAFRMLRIATFLEDVADRSSPTGGSYAGVWPTFVDGRSGDTVQYNADVNDRGDIVDTAFMIQGLLSARQYFDANNAVENDIRARINRLYSEVQWDQYLVDSTICWLWSENLGFYEPSGNILEVTAFSEAQIAYLLAIASPTHPIPASSYEDGWYKYDWLYGNGNEYYGIKQWIGPEYAGYPLFGTHYSYRGFDPRNIADGHCNYYKNNRNMSLINQAYCVDNPWGYAGYAANSWGITSSYTPPSGSYQQNQPDPDPLYGIWDHGVIAPTAAVCAVAYTPDASKLAIRNWYDTKYDTLWGPFGFYDAFSDEENWTAAPPYSYIPIDQNPMVPMIENYLTGFSWDLFMSCPEINTAINAIGFYKDPEDNMLFNGNFDEGDVGSLATITVPGWTMSGWNGEVHKIDGKTIGGQTLKLGNAISMSREMTVTEGKDYEFSGYLVSFDVFGEQLLSGQAVIKVQWLTAGSSVIRTDTVGVFEAGVDSYDEWKYANVTLQAPANSANVKIIAQLENAAGYAHFDGISMLPSKYRGDITGDGTVDFNDLAILFGQWLSTPVTPSADIAPETPDGSVNFLDLVELAENWLDGV